MWKWTDQHRRSLCNQNLLPSWLVGGVGERRGARIVPFGIGRRWDNDGVDVLAGFDDAGVTLSFVIPSRLTGASSERGEGAAGLEKRPGDGFLATSGFRRRATSSLMRGV